MQTKTICCVLASILYLISSCLSVPQQYSKYLFEGDILGVEMVPFKMNYSLPEGIQLAAPRKTAKTWPGGIVPFTFDNNFDQVARNKVREALEYFMENVNQNGKNCIKFVERTNQQDYISVVDGDGCHSHVGVKGGKQELSLNIKGCVNIKASLATIVHEFMHAIGFWHEQSRPDRDEYVKILVENIEDPTNNIHNFHKFQTDEAFMSGPYDYGSVMHYQAEAFAKKGTITIIQLKDGPKIGQEEGFSKNDIIEIRKHYRCGNDGEIMWNQDMRDFFEWAPGCVFRGNHFNSVTSQNALQCGTLCRNTPKCTHFNFNLEKTTCFLKEQTIDENLNEVPVKKNHALKVQDSVGHCGILMDSTKGSTLCADYNSLYCNYWAWMGECTLSPNFMLTSCCYSCSFMNCQDHNTNCKAWANLGQCQRYPGYMLNACCKSCRQSSVSQDSNDCNDAHHNCEDWARNGQCEANPGYMLVSCCKSCHNLKNNFQLTNDCVDQHNKCEEWAIKGECNTKPGYMLKKCCNSCRESKGCKNLHNNCNYWARIGECDVNPTYMLTKCCKSCKESRFLG